MFLTRKTGGQIWASDLAFHLEYSVSLRGQREHLFFQKTELCTLVWGLCWHHLNYIPICVKTSHINPWSKLEIKQLKSKKNLFAVLCFNNDAQNQHYNKHVLYWNFSWLWALRYFSWWLLLDLVRWDHSHLCMAWGDVHRMVLVVLLGFSVCFDEKLFCYTCWNAKYVQKKNKTKKKKTPNPACVLIDSTPNTVFLFLGNYWAFTFSKCSIFSWCWSFM